MPYLNLRTNIELSTDDETRILKRLSGDIAKALGKPESYVMIAIEGGLAMSFSGSQDPLAYIELKSIGLPESATEELSQTLCRAIEDETPVKGQRIYIEFTNAQRHLWGWNHDTF